MAYRYILLLLLILLHGNLLAQGKNKLKKKYAVRYTPGYTTQSLKYITHQQTDSIQKAVAKEIFEEYRLPDTFFVLRYPIIKPLLQQAVYLPAREAFTKLEKNSSTTEINLLQQQYQDTLKAVIRNVINQNRSLQQLLSFTNSDRITNFTSDVTVQLNGQLLVKETIEIYNGNGSFSMWENDAAIINAGGGNNEIKRGIFRNFPVWYRDKYKLNYRTTFRLLKIEHNGQPAEYVTENQHNGINIKIGNAYTTLPVGKHTYVLEYETGHQLKFLPQLDELAWNVTGNGWNFRIEKASCTIHLPAGTSLMQNACYTGVQGSTLHYCTVNNIDSNTIQWTTALPLLPYEGLSVGAGFSKGFVTTPSIWATRKKLLLENQLVFLFPVLALLILIYNFIVWYLFGRDVKNGVVIPQFYPPEKLSPAAMGFIYNQKHSTLLTSATLVDLAVRHFIKINVEREGVIFKQNVYYIEEPDMPPVAATYHDYNNKAQKLIDGTIKKGTYNATLAGLDREIKNDCTQKYQSTKLKKGFFNLNNRYMAPGNLLIVLLSAYLIFAVVPVIASINAYQLIYAVIGFITCIIIQVVFYKIMPAYTASGQQAMNDIDGFRMYLKTTDEHRFNFMNPPEKNLALYEKYLPFAIALDCEMEWGEKFKDIIATTVTDNTTSGGVHHSSSSLSNFRSSGVTGAIAGGLAGSISSASTPPSSSSGGSSFSGGGGSSGGGGGGGGGGGW